MAKLKSKGLVPSRPIPTDITEIAQLINSDQIERWSMEQRRDGGVKFHGVSPLGDAIIIEKKTLGGYARTVTETMNKPRSIEERRERVKALRSEGMTQAQIALRTGYSQKTISNDCNELDI